MSERINKTSICSVVFLDIVDYSKLPGLEQSDLKDQFNALINEAIKDVAQNDRIILDTGDGAAISLLGAPEEALFVSMTIRDGILKHNETLPDQPLFVRIGINLGPVRVVSDINGQPNIIGDGINVAQRVMSFAEPNQILVSRSYYEVTSRLTKEITGMFTYSGIKHDKHVREHEVYVIRPREDGTPPAAAELAVPAAAATAPAVEAGARPLGKTGWIILGVLLAGLLSAALYWSAKMRVPEPPLADPMLNIPVTPALPLVESPPAETKAKPAPEPALAKSDATVADDAKKPIENKKKPTRRKKASASKPQENTKSMEPGVGSSGAGSSGTPHSSGVNSPETHTAPHKAEPPKHQPQENTPEKSGWDNFKNSVKQGGKKECTQGEIAMGQCR